MNSFTPLSALLGGALIGLSAALLLQLNGRIAGISGITGGLLAALKNRSTEDGLWRALFLIGLITGAGGYFAITGHQPTTRHGFPPGLLILSGLLVGYGTSLGSGCTSGHGVCGLGRLSWRSLIATLVFMATGMLTTWFVRQVSGMGS